MSENPEEAEREMDKAIFISADCWLKVFDLLPPSQLGLGIALISRRFDCFVDEHFKTRKWTLGQMRIQSKIGENGGAKEMAIVNSNLESLPIPQNPLPNKVIGFKSISIIFFDQTVLHFLRLHFHRFFASCATQLAIASENVRLLEFICRNIWPMFNGTICALYFNSITFRQMRRLAPSLLTDCTALRVVVFDDWFLPEIPPAADDSANALSDGQAVAKWLFTPRSDNVPKMLRIEDPTMAQWSATVAQIKAAFSIASSPVNFGISVFLSRPPFRRFSAGVVPFKLTNQLTGEQLTLSSFFGTFRLIRCPIGCDYAKWETAISEEFNVRLNKIYISIKDDLVDNSLLDDAASPEPSDDGQQYIAQIN